MFHMLPVNSSSTSAEDTQPHLPIRARLRQNGGCWLVLLTVIFFTLFACGSSLVFYLVFPPAPVDLLIMGLDSRGQEGFLSRTDSIMLLGIIPANLRVSLLSIPRDVFIDVPGYGMQRINTINLLGEMKEEGSGPQLLMQSIANNFGIVPDRYIRLDFTAFADLVDAVGGITIDVERVIIDQLYPSETGGWTEVRFESGLQQMDGKRALIYARTRHGSDDYQRAARQQQVVSAVAKKLLNPLYWPGVLSILQRSMDTNLTLWDMLAIAPPMLLNAGRFEQMVISRDYLLGTARGNAIPNYELIAPWTQERFN